MNEDNTQNAQEPDGYYSDDMGNNEEIDMSFLDDEEQPSDKLS